MGSQRLRQPALEFGPPFVKRAIEDVIPDEQPSIYVRFQFIDIAVFEHALGKRQLLCSVVDEERAIYKFASIKPRKNYLASKIEMLSTKVLAVDDTLFGWSVGCHFFACAPLFGTIAKPLSMAALNTDLSPGSAMTSSAALKGVISCQRDRGLASGSAVSDMA
ncbi:hypothetical protein JQ609_32440 [Bradyrhizobium sp. AUGA SZCCT0169]|uniref:hypothetical protein n=1 Tax=unclassified Bradyrhizobium TaxID=2631580 RepID=UPI001BA600F8|nr:MULTISPECIES: hypothetical protein [unclassified Bradyrhizobium]MBR1194087.1 hypothetical protein [Bradyrhizobium sp. AUGA SZCCT0160]MBR1251612.1 hypothetical protein [Bradyrhizobium sp. AUGA SZCCT0169]